MDAESFKETLLGKLKGHGSCLGLSVGGQTEEVCAVAPLAQRAKQAEQVGLGNTGHGLFVPIELSFGPIQYLYVVLVWKAPVHTGLFGLAGVPGGVIHTHSSHLRVVQFEGRRETLGEGFAVSGQAAADRTRQVTVAVQIAQCDGLQVDGVQEMREIGRAHV